MQPRSRSRRFVVASPSAVSFTGDAEGDPGKKIAYSPDFGYARVEPEVAAICRAPPNAAEAGAC